MRAVNMFLAANVLISCSAPQNVSNSIESSSTTGCTARLDIPRVSPSANYEHWHLIVSKVGLKRWNGQDVDTDTARRYMVELSKMSASAGSLVVHLEPGISCKVVDEVKRMTNESPLCSNHRCFQDKWDYERPIVN